MSKQLGYHALALFVVAVWGLTFISTKVLIAAGLHPALIFAIRFLMAYIGIWIVCVIKKNGTRIWSLSLRDELIFAVLGITGGSLYFLAENNALVFTQACNVSFIVCSAPLWTALLTILLRKTFKGGLADGLEEVRLGWKLVFATVLCLGGVALITFDGSALTLSPKGDLMALGAALCWAVYSVLMSQMTEKYGTLFATRKVFFWGLLTIIPFIMRDLPAAEVFLRPDIIFNLLFLGLVASLICFVVWDEVMARLGNITSTNYVYLNPIFTLIGASAILGERMTLMSAFGSVAILAGVIVAGSRGKAR